MTAVPPGRMPPEYPHNPANSAPLPPLPPPPGVQPEMRPGTPPRRRWLPPLSPDVTVPMRAVGIAQFVVIGLLALFIGLALLVLVLALFFGPFFFLVFEAILAPVIVVAALIPLHFVIATGLFAMRRWGIALLGAASAGYVLASVGALIEGQNRTADALRSRIVLSLILWAVLALLNALACSQWRHAR